MTNQKMHYAFALLPILVLIILLAYNVSLYGDNSLEGANQLALLFSSAIAVIIGLNFGTEWKDILNGIKNNISNATPSLIILLLIGALAGTWLISGIVPAMIYYGLQTLHPKIFLFAAVIISAVVSLATGSSWSTIATIGVALLGIGQALGFPTGLIAGGIISGAYFGDKMSPLSDTTNLAPAISGTDLFKHIRYMMHTTIPSFIITLVLFLIIGFNFKPTGTQDINELILTISNTFNVTGWLFLVPILVIVLIIKKTPAIPTLLIGGLLGGVFAIIFQPEIVMSITNTKTLNYNSGYMAIINAMGSNITITTDHQMINSMLSTSGMSGMLNTIWLIICAMIFGATMETTGLLNRITIPLTKYAKNTGSLITTTSGTCIFFNITASDQYLSIIVPGRMFADTYKERGLSPENLSRTLEDSGTVTSVLVPWNTCGATQSAILGVSTFSYLPYCFFNIISPCMTIAYAYLNIRIKQLEE